MHGVVGEGRENESMKNLQSEIECLIQQSKHPFKMIDIKG